MDLERDRTYIIHQILKYGTFADIQWLFKTYSKKDVSQVFINKPSKSYPKPLFYTIETLIKLANKKFTGEFHDKLFLEQLIYFNGLEIIPTAFLKEKHTPEEIKAFLEHEAETCLKKILP